MKMSACWMFVMILMGCRSSHASQSTCVCTACAVRVSSLQHVSEWSSETCRNIPCYNRPQPTLVITKNANEPWRVCVPAGGDVQVPCPKLTADEMNVNLFWGEEMIYNHSCSQADTCISSNTSLDIELHKNTEKKSASFRLTNVNASSYGLYRCEGTLTYPPPLKTIRSESILVLIDGYQCKTNCSNVTTAADPEHGFHWIWVCGLTSMYSIMVTIVAIVFWVKLRRTDSQSDYINTKPRATRDRKKNRQNPILPRHF